MCDTVYYSMKCMIYLSKKKIDYKNLLKTRKYNYYKYNYKLQ